jgi:hypothetical protein
MELEERRVLSEVQQRKGEKKKTLLEDFVGLLSLYQLRRSQSSTMRLNLKDCWDLKIMI